MQIINTEVSTRFRPRPWRKPTEAEAREQLLHAALIEANRIAHETRSELATYCALNKLFPELSDVEISRVVARAIRLQGLVLMPKRRRSR